MKERLNIDQLALEREYRRGHQSNRELARRFGCTETYVRKLAKKNGWTRDLTEQIDGALRRAIVRREAGAEKAESQVVEIAADLRADIVIRHRSDIVLAQQAVRILLHQAWATADNISLIEALVEDDTKDEKVPTRREAMLAAVSLPARAATLDRLASAMQKLIALEREAYNIGERDTGEKSYEERLKAIEDATVV